MKWTFSIVAAMLAFALCAEESAKMTKEEFMKLSPDARRDYIAALSAKKTGGTVVKPGSGRGIVKIINSQKDVDLAELKSSIKNFLFLTHLDVRVEDGESVTVATAKGAIEKVGAQAAVFIVSADELPRVLVSPEEGWAIVNVKALSTDSPKPEVLNSRVCKEAMRGFAFVGSMGQAARYTPVLETVGSLQQLDRIENINATPDCVRKIPIGLSAFGIEPKTVKVYRKACEEGWAPAPTNDVQKAIWNDVHKVPEKPMTIKFDKSKGE